MALSGTTTFSYTVAEVCNRSLRLAGILGSSETPDSTMYSESRGSLNLVLNDLESFTQPLWQRDLVTLSSAECLSGSSLAQSVVEVIQVTELDNNLERPVQTITYDQFLQIPDKTTNTSNTISHIAFTYLWNGLNFHIYPTPESTYSGSLKLLVLKRPNDCTENGQSIQIPVKYYQMLTYGVALDLMYLYQRDFQSVAQIKNQYEYYRAMYIKDNTRKTTNNFVRGCF